MKIRLFDLGHNTYHKNVLKNRQDSDEIYSFEVHGIVQYSNDHDSVRLNDKYITDKIKQKYYRKTIKT